MMDSLIDNVVFSDSTLDIEHLLVECQNDFDSFDDAMFVGICLSECPDGLAIKVRQSCKSDEQLMAALQGAINLFFADHPKEEQTWLS